MIRIYSDILAGCILLGSVAAAGLEIRAQEKPLPNLQSLLADAKEHEKATQKLRENSTYSAAFTTETLDEKGRVTKTENEQFDVFFVNGHAIERKVRKDGRPLTPHEDAKETERVTKLIAKAEKTPRDEPLTGSVITLGRLLSLMDVGPARRVISKGRPTILFDFKGNKNAKTHGMEEGISKNLHGSIWIDEADRQPVCFDVTVDENFRVGGGLLGVVEKGTHFHGEDALVGDHLWLPSGMQTEVNVRAFVAMKIRERISERDYDYKRFNVDAQSAKDAKPK